MTDPDAMEFNIDYGTLNIQPPQPTRPAPPSAPMYASIDGRVASLSNSECIFQARDDGGLHVMTHQVLQALDQCREFRTLDEHIARITSVIPGLAGQGEAVRRVLTNLVERGLLRSDQQFLDGLQSGPEHSPLPLRALAIRTCDRPAQLRALLDSLRAHQARFGRRDAVLLIDDSRDSSHRRGNRDLLAAYAAETGAKVHWVGPDEARSLGEQLARARPEAAQVLPALLQQGNQPGFGGGRGYNLALLLTAGGALSLIDDDYLLPFHRGSVARDGLEPVAWTQFVARFHASGDEALAAGSELDEDGLALQHGLVGATLGAVMGGSSGRYRLTREQLRGQSLARLAYLRADAHVLATFTGSRGASFTSDSAWLYQLPAPWRNEFWAERESYLRNIEADALEFVPERLLAREFGLFTPFMLDNSRLLPCTSVLGRGEDGLFGVISHYMYPRSLTLHLPITIGHRQEGRRGRFERATQALTPGFNRFLRDWVRNQAVPARASDPAARLALLAAQMEDLAHASERERIDVLHEYLRYVRADLIDRLQQQLLSEPRAPVYWAADLRRIVEANGRALLEEGVPRLEEWPADIDAAGCAGLLRERCLALADAFRHWPAVWQTAAEMGEALLPA